MGADIHMFVEWRLSKKDPWSLDKRHVLKDGSIEETSVGYRWYTLFGLLANVRGSKRMYDSRGLPNDCDARIKDVYDSGYQYHSGSWLTINEFKKAIIKAYDFDNRNNYSDGDEDDVELHAYSEIARGDPFFDWKNTDYDDHPGYDDLINHFHLWCFNKILDNHMYGKKYRPEVRIVFFFDS